MSIRVKTILLIVGSTLILLLVSSLITTIIFTLSVHGTGKTGRNSKLWQD